MAKNFKNLMSWKKSIGIALVLVMAISIFYGFDFFRLNDTAVLASDIAITAVDLDKLGIDTTTTFLLTSKESLTEKTVKASLKLRPEFSYTLDKQNNGKSYKIIPKEKLAPNTIYRLAFDPEASGKENLCWAFQTKAAFQVLRSLPGDKSTSVPVDTGIELTFSSDNYEISSLKNYFSISPEVKGAFEKHKKTLVFTPEALQPATVYTVTLKKGFVLPGTTETLFEDYRFSFETGTVEQNNPPFTFDLNTSLTEFSTSEQPAFSVYFTNNTYSGGQIIDTPPLHINLYRYPDHQSFQASLSKRDVLPDWSYYTWNHYLEKLPSAYILAEYDTEFLKTDPYNQYIMLPETLEAGYYSAEFQADESVRQVWFQVTDLAVYLAQGQDESLFWVNDLQTKTSVAEATVSLENKKITASTDKSGTVLIKQKLSGEQRSYAWIRQGDKEILVPIEAWYEESNTGQINPSDYWKYLYLDRALYKPGDTLNFWGIAAPRSGNSTQGSRIEPLRDLTIEVYGYDGAYYPGGEISPVLTQETAVKDDCFQGQIKLPVLKPGYYELQVKSGDVQLLSRSFSVENYQKPAYQVTLTQDKKAIFAGEKVNFRFSAAFFESTPVPSLSLHYFLSDQEGDLTTDAKGTAILSYTGKAHAENYTDYDFQTCAANATLPEAGEIYNYAELLVFKSKVYINGQAIRQKDTYTLSAKLSSVDLTKLNNGEFASEENYLQGPVANAPVKAKLYQEVVTRTETGQYYDFISKKVVKSYNYDYATKLVSEFALTTASDGTLKYTGQIDPKESYNLYLTAQDSDGRSFTRQLTISKQDPQPDNAYYFLQGTPGIDGYNPGDQVQVSMMVNSQVLNPAGRNILFYHGQKVIDAYQVSTTPKYSFSFTDLYIPNVTVGGVYFDGNSYYEASSVMIPFASQTKKLNVAVQSDKTEYRPGDKVHLNLKVTDSNNAPVKRAQINLNLVDEALFSLQNQSVDFLNSLYGDNQYLTLVTRKSHYHPGFYGFAESGGEGGSGRSDFRDTVLFTTLQTDSGGNASTDFTLPDNLTSWRVTYQAFTQNLQAGSGTSQLPVRLPFFVEVTLNSHYLAGDSPVVLTRSYGEKLKSSQNVSYTMKLTSPSGKEQTWRQSNTAFSAADWKLPALEAGIYRLTVSGSQNGLTDTLTKEFTAVKSFQQRIVSDQNLLTEGQGLKGSSEEPTTVIFSDSEKSQYLRGLYQLIWNNGSRLEQKLAAQEAARLLEKYFSDSLESNIPLVGDRGDRDSLLLYQRFDGGISILSYEESDPTLSAMVASAAPGVFDDQALIRYFYRILEAEDAGESGKEGDQGNQGSPTPAADDESMILLGLASLGEPVLLQIDSYMQKEDLSAEEKINLALALLETGDGAYAKQVYQELLSTYQQDLGSVLRINVGSDQDDMILATTRMALLAARLDQPEKNKLYQYLLENPGKDILNTLEQLEILRYNLQYMASSPVSFTYELNGKKETKILKNMNFFKLTILPEDLTEISFTRIKGKIGMVSYYNVPIQAGEGSENTDLEISRTYRVGSTETNTFNRQNLVQVVLSYNIGDKAPQGLYEIVDVLPAGLALIPRPENYNEDPTAKNHWDYPTEVNGQKLVFHVGKDKGTITYLARVISPGEFNCEAPVLSNIKNSIVYTSGSQSRIVIK